MCVYTIHVTTRLSDDDTKNGGGGGGGEEEEEEDRHAHVINPRAAKRRRRRVDLTDVKDHIKSAASAVAVALISCYSFTRCFTISSCRSSFLLLFSEKRRDLVEDEEEKGVWLVTSTATITNHYHLTIAPFSPLFSYPKVASSSSPPPPSPSSSTCDNGNLLRERSRDTIVCCVCV